MTQTTSYTADFSYMADFQPGDNPDYPWHVSDGDTYLGPCFTAHDAALIAWALNHADVLEKEYESLRMLVNHCIDRTMDYNEANPENED